MTTTALGTVPVVRHNDWGVLRPPSLDAWVPTRTVSVVVPAWNCGATLPLTLASLAAQTYPASLLEVVVVDDGNSPPMSLPEVRPERTRVVRAPDSGWGRAHACHAGALQAEGEVLHWLDADMVVFDEHVAAQVRWHDVAEHLVTLGYKRFVGPRPMTPQEVFDAVRAGRGDTLYDDAASAPHAWIEKIIDDTDALRTAGAEAFRVHVGATASLTRGLYLSSGGMDTRLKLGEDIELGYRLAQAGAVFVPEPGARSWHLGPSTVMRTVDVVSRYNKPFLTDRMPLPRFRRRREPGRLWSVPLVDVRVHVPDAEADYETVKATVDSALRSTVPDLAVTLVGTWALGDERRSTLQDPQLDRRLLMAEYEGEPRVRFADADADAPSSFPAAFRLELPLGWVVGKGTVEQLVADAERRQLSLLLVALPGVAPDVMALRLERTSAVQRVLRVAPDLRPGTDEFDDVLERVGGQRWYDGTDLDLHLGSAVAPPEVPSGAAPVGTEEWRKAAQQARADAQRWKADALRWKAEAKAQTRQVRKLTDSGAGRGRLSPRRVVRGLVRRVRLRR